MWNRLERYQDLGLLIARVGFGLAFFWYHGYPKLTGGAELQTAIGSAISNFGIDFAPRYWGIAAGTAEAVGGLLIALGLFFRPAAIAIMLTMIVAMTNHFVTGQGTPAHAIKNAFVAAGAIFVGPGRYSLDYLISRRRSRQS